MLEEQVASTTSIWRMITERTCSGVGPHLHHVGVCAERLESAVYRVEGLGRTLGICLASVPLGLGFSVWGVDLRCGQSFGFRV